MNKLYGSFAAKLIAVILLCLMALVFIASAIGAITVGTRDGYTGSFQNVEQSYYQSLGQDMLSQIGDAYEAGGLTEETESYFTENGSFWFEILDREKNVLLSNYEGGKTLWEGARIFQPSYHVLWTQDDWAENTFDDDISVVTPTPHPTADPETVPSTPAPAGEDRVSLRVRTHLTGETLSFESEEELNTWVMNNRVTVKGYLPDPLPESFSEAKELQALGLLFSWRYDLLWTGGLSLLLGVLLFIFLMNAAGHRKGTDKIVPGFVERIPFDVLTVLVGGAIVVCLMPLTGGWDWPEIAFVLVPVVLCAGLLLLFWFMSMAVRVKTRTLWSGCLVVRFFRWLRKGLGALLRHLPLLWKWALGLAAAALVDLIFRMNAVWSEARASTFWFLFWLLAAAATLYAVLAFKRLRKGAGEIADGNLLATVEEKHLVGDFKDHARDLNRIRDGLNAAVEERLKSERFRTELITNVSHDIKTPLTSIVNYVDLLQKEEPKTEKQQEYLEVLSRQSGKLKKLIEDLIEASKASTGNLTVDLQPCDLSILLDQTAGEYGEKLEQAGLELVLQKPEHPVTVKADGRHLWRVFDNLLNNIVKYAQPGTRVYLSLQERAGEALVTFRNISREPLNISAAELTERFVQGDASRHSDGNGLGLAIAMSLMRLQKGDLDIDLDGDLFKVTLRFPGT